jgi:hypothetical protein
LFAYSTVKKEVIGSSETSVDSKRNAWKVVLCMTTAMGTYFGFRSLRSYSPKQTVEPYRFVSRNRRSGTLPPLGLTNRKRCEKRNMREEEK